MLRQSVDCWTLASSGLLGLWTVKVVMLSAVLVMLSSYMVKLP